MKKIITIFLLLVLFYGCTTPIRRIVKHPEKLHSKNVRVKGKVVSSLLLEDLRIFYVQDKYKKHIIPIVTKNYLPIKNDYVIVRGHVINNYSYNNKKKMVVVYEKDSIRKITPDKMKYDKNPRYKYIDNKTYKYKDFNFGGQ